MNRPAEENLAEARRKIVFPLDFPTPAEAESFADRLGGQVGIFKVGLELFIAAGPSVLRTLPSDTGIFLDLKLHDIPATMGRSVARAAAMEVALLTVHGLAGRDSLRQAAENAGSTRLLAVTVLTSLDAEALESIGLDGGPREAADRLAKLAWDAGVRGLVTSAHECAALRDALGQDAFLVTPGIRPSGSATGDQKRVMTPADAIAAGADLLVVGRPIRDASNPNAAAADVARQVQLALTQ